MIALLKREIRLALRSGGGAGSALLFYLAVVVAIPFAVGPNAQLLSTIGGAVLWIGAMLASLLGLERLFQVDREDGSLDHLMMARQPLAALIFVKSLAHWLVTGLPLALVSPVFALFLTMEPVAIGATFVTLLVGTPALSFIGAVGAAVTVGLPRGGLLLSILVLPLCIPVVIFGVGAVRGAVTDPDPFTMPFLILCAISLFFMVLGPLGAALALRQGRA
ncbi:heme exporter protein CcmB [Pseudahrensia aquimaris]|uniref:Heme exporter protein B n=1 Tax=Pseudahrensia aquimaris TaxID=744461 RepID=A0ABW3FGK7_9HYPH